MYQEPTIWFYEDTGGIKLGLPVTDVLYHTKTAYQELYVMEIKGHGRALVLDDCLQFTEKDEFVYHELIIHPPLFTHPCPENVLVIGGGDGGSVREITKHSDVKRVDLIEIDEEVIKVSHKFFPSLNIGFKDKRVQIHIQDGCQYVKETPLKYDVAIVDSTDPIGPAKVLYESDFHRSLAKCLKKDGLMVIQTECPYYNAQFIKELQSRLKKIYPIVRLYVYAIPTYPGGMWSFMLASFKYDPLKVDEQELQRRWLGISTKYYNPLVHKGVFYVVPQFMYEEGAK